MNRKKIVAGNWKMNMTIDESNDLINELKELSNYYNSKILMEIDRGKNLQKSELDTFKNYRGRWKKN